MKKTIIGMFLLVALVIPISASAATLTGAQISAIITILQSFGIDQATVNNINSVLRGGNTAPTSTPIPLPTYQSTVVSQNYSSYSRSEAVRHMYLDLLGREPEQNGLNYWVNGSLTLNQIKEGIQASYEYTTKQSIVSLYRNLLSHEPDNAGLVYWYAQVYEQHKTLDQVKQGIMNTTEYQNRTSTTVSTQSSLTAYIANSSKQAVTSVALVDDAPNASVSNAIFWGFFSGGTYPYKCYWDLGDASVDYNSGYQCISPTAMGVKYRAGTYNVKFKVVDANGATIEARPVKATMIVNAATQQTIVTSPKPSYFSQSSAAVGTVITLYGSGFDTVGDNTVSFISSGSPQTVATRSTNGTTLTFSVPASLPAQTYSVTVSSRNVTSVSIPFTVTTEPKYTKAIPSIYSITPTSGPMGTVVTLSGGGFNTDRDNIINISDGAYGYSLKVRASQSVLGTILKFTLPSPLEVKTYKISVDNDLLSNIVYFTVTPTVVIVSAPIPSYFSQSSAAVGTVITLYGSGFDTVGDNTVSFISSGSPQTVATRSTNGTTLTFSVPASLPAQTYSVTVSSRNVTSVSIPFTVTTEPKYTKAIPSIYSITPTSGPMGTVVTLSGGGFNTDRDNIINISDGAYGYSLKVRASQSVLGTILKFTLPSPLEVKTYKISVDNDLLSNIVYFTVTPTVVIVSAPIPSYFSQSSAAVGTVITLYGSGFDTVGDNTVSFISSGSPQTVATRSTNGTTLTFSVPASLPAQTYSVTVSSRNVTSVSIPFTVTTEPKYTKAIPSIYSITPTSGPMGTVVTLSGGGFNTDRDNIINISDGAYGYSLKVRASQSVLGTILKFTLPSPLEVKTYKISVDNDLLSNIVYFTVTPSPTGSPISERLDDASLMGAVVKAFSFVGN